MDDAATPETGAVDAPASMDSVLAEFETGNSEPQEDAVKSAVEELVNEAEEGDADEAADDGKATEPANDGEADKAPADEPTKDDLDTTRMVTVKVDGADVEVPLSEALKGYSREADYTKKTQALAEERRGLETKLSTQYAEQLKQATDRFVQLDPLLAEANQIDWQALAQQDPTTYTQLKAAVEARQQAVGQAQAELQRVQQAQSEQETAALNEGIKATEAAIRSSDPAFADDAKFAEYVKTTVGELGSVGLDSDDLSKVLASPDAGPKILSLVHDAMQFRAQQKAKATLPERKVVPVSQARPLRPDATGSSTPQRRTPPSNASRDSKVSWAVKQMTEGL